MAGMRPKFDKMWRIWYAILVLLLHLFLIYSAFQRYGSFRQKALREAWHMGPMNFYLVMMLFACFQLPLFLYFAFVRTRNYAEEGVQIGKDEHSVAVAMAAEVGARACLRRMRRHFMPYTCVLHLLMALCLLMPLPVLEAAEISHSSLPKSAVWRTNFDFVLAPTASARNAISIEAFNLMLALFILVVRYPTAFWFANRAFAFLFSLILFACSLHVLVSYEASSVLFKAASVDAGASLAAGVVLPLHWLGDLLLLLANVAFFEFGHAQLVACLRRYRRCLQLDGAGDPADQTPCWLDYAPQLSGILLMAVAVVLKAPLLWDWVGLYSSQRQAVLLTAAVSGCAYFVLWVAAWFVLGLRANWRFNARLEASHKLAGYHDNGGLTGSPERSRAGSDLSSGKHGNHYVFVQRDALIPTISEQVDTVSDVSYEKQTSTLDRQNGLVKYQVLRRNSQVSSACGSLRRQPSRRPPNRVTFKDNDGSPDSSQNASSDSGFGSARPQANRSMTGVVEVDDYASVSRTQPTAFSNYDDYPMFGSLFREPDYCSRHELQAAPTYASHSDIYGRLGHCEPDSSDIPVPDLLLSRSPYGSLARGGAYTQLPPAPAAVMDETVDTLCSQV